jgi:hypothetical protein
MPALVFASNHLRRVKLGLGNPLLILGLMLLMTVSSSCDSPASVGTPPPPASKAGAPVQGETYLWRPVAIGGGGFITGYDFDNSGQVRVARADVHGAYIWRSDLNRWAQLVTADTMPADMRVQDGANEGVFEIAVAPSNPDRIYMALKGGLLRSDDRGKSFTRISPKAAPFPLAFDPNSPFRHYGPFLAISPTTPDLVLFGSPEDGLWRSQNGGKDWSEVNSLPTPALKFAKVGRDAGLPIWFEKGPQNAATGRIWAMSHGRGVYVSRDNGQSFVPLTAPNLPQPRSLRQGTFAPDGTFFGVDNAGKAVWRYSGGEWINLTTAPGLSPQKRRSLCF